ncbi:hypothetical protein TELCIR_02325 [Teladorsagia circumcincta]|uniref:RNA-directed DNA polymerase n=1 Tax=Teladorsagia circumcincta TaxID=45464 RepID=A0A2G9UZD4_TELCI|nr:hypothetical protein TELCIR_02325 [Teladorsagia circumcincta]
MVRMKALARSYAYWLGIDQDIENAVRRCIRCSAVAKLPFKATLASWPEPDAPWKRIHVDYAVFLLTYRSTPSQTDDGNKFPAELFIGRKLRTDLALLKPITQRTPVHNQSMESQFNEHHGARNRAFNSGDPVLVRQYHGNHEEWSNGKILKRVGEALFEVLVGNKRPSLGQIKKIKAKAIATTKVANF